MQALSTLFAPKRFPNLKWLFQAVGAGRGAVNKIDVESFFRELKRIIEVKSLFFSWSCKFQRQVRGIHVPYLLVLVDAAPKMWFFLEMSI